jgi:hypothetical protein
MHAGREILMEVDDSISLIFGDPKYSLFITLYSHIHYTSVS